MKTDTHFQAKLLAPFGVLGIFCTSDALTGIEFLASNTLPQAPDLQIAEIACLQLTEYFKNPNAQFNLPYKLEGTAHQKKVWQSMCDIPRGKTRQYGEIAIKIASSPRAVGQACGSNPLPIIIPCHRVVSKTGLGGFANYSEGYTLEIKRWLLAHEQY